MGINVLLMVKDASKSLAFYQQLGFIEQMILRKHGRVYYAEMSFQGRDNHYMIMFLEQEWWLFPQESEAREKGSGVLIYIPVDHVDAVYEQVKEQSHVICPPRDLYYGREMVIADEDGYKLAFIQEYPGKEHLSEGMEVWRRE